MMLPSWMWLVLLPIVSSPLVYILGNILQRARGVVVTSGLPSSLRISVEERRGAGGRGLANPIRWVALAVLLADFIPFGMAWRDLANGAAPTFKLGIIAMHFDGISLLLSAAVLGLGVLISLFSGPYIRHEGGQEKYHALLGTMVGAMIGLGCAADLFNLWVWFEAAAVASYMLVAYHTEQPSSVEAGVKYLVQNSVGSMLALLGIGLVFSQAGTLDLEALRIAAAGHARLPYLAAGALFCVGFGVKIAMVPMHTWLPDAHSQAPSGISALLSGIVIETGLIALLRALSVVAGLSASWGPVLLVFGAVNMLVGNLLALRQTQIKRLLAFSSLSHVGYMLLGIGTAIAFHQLDGAQGGLFHLLTHALMKGLAFLAAGCLLFALRLSKGDSGPLTTDDLAGASRRYPLAALGLTVGVLGLGGLPPLAGFMSKWQIFAAGFHTGSPVLIALVIFALLNSLLSLGYYAPIVNIMYRREPSALVTGGLRVPPAMAIPIVLLIAGVLALGVWPSLADGLTAPAGRVVLDIFSSTGGM